MYKQNDVVLKNDVAVLREKNAKRNVNVIFFPILQ